MIIIIEGPDGAGKSRLAEQLARQTGYPIIHRTQPKTEAEKELMMQGYLEAIQLGKNAIFDRCWYSEIVYGKVMRDKSCITWPQMYALEERVAKNGGIVIYCTGPRAELWKRCQKRGETYITSKDQFNSICEGYDELFNDAPHHIPVVSYVYANI